jgi:cobalt-zinc-cadmium efflux system membrane fusion protein
MKTYVKYICLIAALITVWGCSKKPKTKENLPPPAKVHNAVKETALTTITLTEEAESRLGIQTARVAYRAVAKKRTFGGEVVPVSGRSVTVSAPLTGTLLPVENSPVVAAGQRVTNGQPLYRLLLALPEKDLLSVQEEISRWKIELDLAQTKVKRAQQLVNDKAGSVKDLEDAQAQVARARTSLKTAEARLAMLEKGDLDSNTGERSSLIIKSPVDGIIQELYITPGQTVTGTTALLDIASIDPVWIKVPVYVGDLATIETPKPARIHSLADFTGTETQTAVPVAAPFSGDPESITVDTFYELPNPDLLYRPGQKVSVTLPLTGTQESLVVPYSSILYDMYGSAWVYVNTGPRVYVRRRVELLYVFGELAVLSRGPEVGSQVVSAGAAELFGTEFGVGK